MTNPSDTVVMTGPNFQQLAADVLLVTPTGGTEGVLANFLNGGTLAQTGLFTTATVGSFVVPTMENFASIVPAGSNEATAKLVPAMVTQLGTAASTTGVVFGTGASTVPIGQPLLLINSGSAAVHVYGAGYTIDTVAGTTGVTLTAGFGANFVATGTATIVSTNRGTISS